VPPQPVAPAYSSPGKAPRHGPGWGAVLLVTGLCTLLAGLGGGLLGGWLAANGKMSFTSSTPSTTQGPAPTAGAGATTRPAGSIANIAAKAMPSVVTIEVKSGTSEGTGSGWVLDDQGHIVTNNHVVADAANGGDITVVLSNGKQSKATIVGRDQPYDLAVIKVERTDLTPLPVGDSSKVVVGDEVIAVGAPLGLESTVTAGIVSALDRPVAAGSASDTSFINAIQTDAAINPGNSGGPLLNMAGEVIGVNSAIATAPGTGSTGQAGSIGVGFAIPSAQVKKTVEQLITKGKAVHPVIGVYLDQEYEGEGVKVRDSLPNGQDPVTANGPAAKAGLKAGDIIVALNGKPVTNPDALVVGIRALDVGDKVTLTVRRGGKDEDVTMVLEASTD
jgi:putative serine protease PepD